MMSRLTRRGFFETFSDGICGAAIATLLSRDLYGATLEGSDGLPDGHRRMYDLKPRPPHFAPKAKAVIHLFMNGGPSQVDLFDPKPMLEKHDGETYEAPGGQTGVDHTGKLMRSPFSFKEYGKSGIWVSEL